MNNGKICVPVCAPTAAEMIEQIKQAEEHADVIEVRFDCLTRDEVAREFAPHEGPMSSNSIIDSASKPVISTFRPLEQGGSRALSWDERDWFWNSGYETEYCDVEEKKFVDDSFSWLWNYRICSWHDFSGESVDFEVVFDRLADTDAEILKIAAVADDATGALPVWKLLDYAKLYKQISRPKVIPIAMGEAGKWTRILGLAHGAYLTYASLDTGKETADGQITAREMRDVYRVKQVTKQTRVYAVIGDPVSSSLSPYIQNAAFAAAGEDAVFIHMQVKDLDGFMRRMVLPSTREVELNFAGFSVTMPHKRAVMDYLDEIDPVAKKIGAVNTIKIEGNNLIGYNTDAHGFVTPLKKRMGDISGLRAAVIGAGGAARACISALQAQGADVSVFVRDASKADLSSFGVSLRTISDLKFEISNGASYDVVVNATPVGMRGKSQDETLLTADDLSGVKLVYDLVTRAGKTPLLKQAEVAGVESLGGLEMLLAQGARQFEIWAGREAPADIMRRAAEEKMKIQR